MTPKRVEVDTETYSGRIAKRMRRFRDKAKLGVPAVIESMAKAGWEIGEPAYRHWENNTRPPHVDALPAIAKALGVTLDDLLPKR